MWILTFERTQFQWRNSQTFYHCIRRWKSIRSRRHFVRQIRVKLDIKGYDFSRRNYQKYHHFVGKSWFPARRRQFVQEIWLKLGKIDSHSRTPPFRTGDYIPVGRVLSRKIRHFVKEDSYRLLIYHQTNYSNTPFRRQTLDLSKEVYLRSR